VRPDHSARASVTAFPRREVVDPDLAAPVAGVLAAASIICPTDEEPAPPSR
jgi:hypothetical protein